MYLISSNGGDWDWQLVGAVAHVESMDLAMAYIRHDLEDEKVVISELAMSEWIVYVNNNEISVIDDTLGNESRYFIARGDGCSETAYIVTNIAPFVDHSS